MTVHKVTDKKGTMRLIHSGYMNYWSCSRCGYPCGYTWAVPGVIRHAFCHACDSVTEQVSTIDKTKRR